MAHHHHAHGGHDHGHHHGPEAGSTASKNIGLAFFINFFFAIIEFAGGMYISSAAVIAGAVHDLGDSISLGFAYAMERSSHRRSGARFTYGHRRLSLLSALVTALILISGSVVVLSRAITAFREPHDPDINGMLAFAILGILVNGFAAWRTLRGKSLNERMISWHFIEDLLGWTAVLVGAGVMHVMHAPLIDPILSILITLFVMRGVLRNLQQTLRLFLQGVPDTVELKVLYGQLLAIPHVRGVHDLHIWSLDGQSHVLTLHADVDTNLTSEQIGHIKKQVRAVSRAMAIDHVTLELDVDSTQCPDFDCVDSLA